MFDFRLTFECMFDIINSSAVNIRSCMYIKVYVIIQRITIMRSTEYSTAAALQNRRFIYTGLKRRRQLKLRITYLLITMFLVMSSVLLFTCFRSFAQETDHIVRYKYYTSITVPYGCTLEEIAAVHYQVEDYPDINAYMQEICLINRLNSYNAAGNYDVRPGDNIIIPYYSTDFK